MKRAFEEIYDLVRALLRTRECCLEKSLKSKIRETYLKVIFLRRYDSRARTTNVVGFKVNFLSRGALVRLFNEIFVNHEYFFVAENKNPYIIDCGSNIGMSILYFKMLYPDASILAFEPGEEVFSCLETNLRNNNLNSVVANNIALTNREGTIDFYYDQDNIGSLHMSTKRERMPKQKRVVKVSILSKYIDRKVDFLKMDVEGAELEIIEELCNEGKMNYVKQMAIEYHHHIVRDSDEFSKMLQLLEDAGFGYQIQSGLGRPLKRKQFQDILIYAYQKNSSV